MNIHIHVYVVMAYKTNVHCLLICTRYCSQLAC